MKVFKSMILGSMLVLTLGVVPALGAAMNGMKMNDNNTATTTADAQQSFTSLWNQALTQLVLTKDQSDRLANELGNIKMKLSDNFIVLDSLRQQRAKATEAQMATLDKRIELKESERDLIISKAEMTLGTILDQDKLNMVMMAIFHGVSKIHSGNHMGNMNGMDSMNMNNMNVLNKLMMDLGAAAEKLNVNEQAVSLEVVLGTLNNNGNDNMKM